VAEVTIENHRPAQPSWGRVLFTTVRLWAARRSLRRPGKFAWTAAVLCVAAVAAVVVAQLVSAAPARTAPPAATASGAGRSAAPRVSPRPVTPGQAAAAAWITSQVASSAIVGCDPALCAALQARGVDAGRLVPLGTAAAAAPSADLVVVPSSADRELVSRYAPALVASFGAGAARIEIRAVTPGGAAAYQADLRADLLARQSAGSQLLRDPRLAFSAADTAALRSGAVDSRLLATLASLSAQFTLRVVSFSDSSPGAPLLFRAVTVTSSGARSSAGTLAEVRALVNAQLSPYLPAHSAVAGLGPGQTGLLIQFAAPGPLGLLTPALTADTQSVKGH
jgi:hypothetical protein